MTNSPMPSHRAPFRSTLLLSLIALTACTALGEAPRRSAPPRSRVVTKGSQSRTNTTLEGPVERASRNGFAVDRRPIKAINTFNGNLASPHGLQAKWANDDDIAFAWLEKKLDRGFKDGFTRFVLILPAGIDRTFDPERGKRVIMSASHWLPMTPQRRARLASFFQRWIADHPGVTLGYYTGFDLDPDPKNVDYLGHTIPHFDNPDERQAMYDIMAPWMEQAGFTEIWWDYASTMQRRDQAVLFSQWLAQTKGIHAGGEAVPIVQPRRDDHLDDRYVRSMPWMALITYFRQHDPNQEWKIDPKTSEMFIGLRSGDKPTDLELLSAFQRGFIPFVYSDRLSARVMKLWNQSQGNGLSFAPEPATPAHTPSSRGSGRSSRRRVNNSP